MEVEQGGKQRAAPGAEPSGGTAGHPPRGRAQQEQKCDYGTRSDRKSVRFLSAAQQPVTPPPMGWASSRPVLCRLTGRVSPACLQDLRALVLTHIVSFYLHPSPVCRSVGPFCVLEKI